MKDPVTNVLRLASLVRENVRTKQLLTPDNTILVTLSGGQDSICSLLFLYLLQDHLGLTREVVCRHAETKVRLYQPTPRSHSARVRSARLPEQTAPDCQTEGLAQAGSALPRRGLDNIADPSATATKLPVFCPDVLSSQVVQPRRVKKYLSRTAGARRRPVARRLTFVRSLRSGSIERDGEQARRVWLVPAAGAASLLSSEGGCAGLPNRRFGKDQHGPDYTRNNRPLLGECVPAAGAVTFGEQGRRRGQKVSKIGVTSYLGPYSPTSSIGRDKTLPDWLPYSPKLPEQTAPAARQRRARQIFDLAQAGSAARLRRARPHSFYGRLGAKRLCSPKVSISRGLSTRFDIFSGRIDQFGLLWCNHFWQKESFYTMLHIAKLNLCFYSQMCFFLPIDTVLCEQNARDWRHKSIQRTCAFFHYECCTQGHTKSDRVETILFNLLRGTGVTGLQTLQWKKSFYSFSCQRFYPHLSFSKLKWTHLTAALLKRTQELHKIEDSSKLCLVNLGIEPVFKLPTRSFYRPYRRVSSSIAAVAQQE